MSKYEQKPGTGSLFKNDKKTSDKHPDYKGSFKGHDGTDYWLAAWVKSGKNGQFLSIATSKKEAKASNDDMPF